MHDLEPWSYIRHLLILLPDWPHQDVDRLAPAKWRETMKDEEVSRYLAGHLYRRITLGELQPPA